MSTSSERDRNVDKVKHENLNACIGSLPGAMARYIPLVCLGASVADIIFSEDKMRAAERNGAGFVGGSVIGNQIGLRVYDYLTDE